MAIKAICDNCGKELNEFGAVLLSPPNRKREVKKYHICTSCYGQFADELDKKR